MRNLGLSKVTEDAQRPTAGGYVLTITDVEDVPMNGNTGKGDYLKISYDIAEGPFKDYYYGMYKSLGFWGGNLIRSYKPKALGMFKAFIKELKHDNPEFNWNMDDENDEKTMIGRKFGAVIGEEEYRGNDGSIKTRLNVNKIVSIDNIHDGKFKVPELKKIATASNTAAVDTTGDSIETITDDTPF